eukprot:SAG25_NODE_842_length_5107_cov_5.922324_1_plen_205_part_00
MRRATGPIKWGSTRQHSYSHTPSPSTHTHVDTLHAHAHPVSQQEPVEGEVERSREGEGSWGRRDGVESTPRDMLDKPFYPPLFDAFPCFVHACQLLSTQNVTKHCRETVKAHLPHSGKQLAAEYAGCSNSHGAEDGGDALLHARGVRKEGGRVVWMPVPAHDEVIRSRQLRRLSRAHCRRAGAPIRQRGKTCWREGDHDHRVTH